MGPAEIVDVVSRGLTHDADAARAALEQDNDHDDPAREAALVFLRVLSCRFDEALDTAHALASSAETLTPLAKAATALAVAVSAGRAVPDPGNGLGDGPFAELTVMLEVEAALSSGLISTAAEIAARIVPDGPVLTAGGMWSAVALVRAWAFEGRLADADRLLERVMSSPRLGEWPQMRLLASGARIFVDGHLGRSEAVEEGLVELARRCPHEPTHDYIYAGAHVLAAFGASAIGRLPEAAALVLRGGGGVYLPHLQIIDRLYGYEILVEAAVVRGDLEAASLWVERGAGLPNHGHLMAAAALGRIRARLAVARQDTDSGIRESAESGVLAALVGSDLEVIRARIIEGSARATSGDRVRGIEELEEVARRAAVAGAAAVKEWAERELKGHGRRLRNAPGVGWEQLTPAQQTVARMAAAGLRNREIAMTLWVSEKTVESHVAAVLTALGTTNRVGIGRELGGNDIDPVFGGTLTARQREVAVLVSRGHSNSEISAALGISDKTVEKHMAGLFDRLGVRTRAAVAARVRGATAVVGAT